MMRLSDGSASLPAMAPNLALAAALTMAAGIALTRIGLSTRLLRQRHRPRRCVSCGRMTTVRGCDYCR